jgi:5-methylcytosine-specific restriction endonuclease McrA
MIDGNALVFIGVASLFVYALVRWFSPEEQKRKRLSKSRRERIWERDRGRCYNCGRKVPLGWAHIDHITPLSRGGSNDDDNLAVMCPECNTRKGARTPRQAKMRSPHGDERSWVGAAVIIAILVWLAIQNHLI